MRKEEGDRLLFRNLKTALSFVCVRLLTKKRLLEKQRKKGRLFLLSCMIALCNLYNII